jgi:UDP-GlcNAc:undecaprenyl-phosphate/decaprenyl-phosphate GlcNAc-1-phosphate transferase
MIALLFVSIYSFALSLVLTPPLREVLRRLRVMDEPDGFRRFQAKPVVRGGGVPLLLSFLLSLLLFVMAPFSEAHVLNTAMPLLRRLLPGLAVVFATGLLDDVIRLKPWQKVAGQALAGVLAYWGGVRLPLVESHAAGLSLPLTVGWLVLCSNAINLLDGIDGLATGIGILASVATVISALMHQNAALVICAAALAGSLSGFLVYNFSPASIFLGDSGSLTIGFLLGCFGMIWSENSTTWLGMTAPLMLLAMPLLETALSILRRLMRHNPIFQGDREHIHHRLLDRGFSIRGAVLILFATFSLAATFSLLASASQGHYAGVVVALFCACCSAAIWIALDRLGYIELRLAGRMMLRGVFNRRMIHTSVCLWELQQALSSANTVKECWAAILRAARALGFCTVEMRIGQEEFRSSSEMAERLRDCWSVSIPLNGQDYVRLGREFESHAHEFVMTYFIGALRDMLCAKLAAVRAEAHEASKLAIPGGRVSSIAL